MIRPLFIVLFSSFFVLILQFPVCKAESSLFFSEKEIETIDALAEKSPTIIYPAQKKITLDAVIYYGPSDWTVWLQGERWTPSSSRSDMHIIEVKPDYVRLSLTPLEGGAQKEIALRPHQAYDPVSGKISIETNK